MAQVQPGRSALPDRCFAHGTPIRGTLLYPVDIFGIHLPRVLVDQVQPSCWQAMIARHGKQNIWNAKGVTGQLRCIVSRPGNE